MSEDNKPTEELISALELINVLDREPDRNGNYVVYDENQMPHDRIGIYRYDAYTKSWFIGSDAFHPSYWTEIEAEKLLNRLSIIATQLTPVETSQPSTQGGEEGNTPTIAEVLKFATQMRDFYKGCISDEMKETTKSFYFDKSTSFEEVINFIKCTYNYPPLTADSSNAADTEKGTAEQLQKRCEFYRKAAVNLLEQKKELINEPAVKVLTYKEGLNVYLQYMKENNGKKSGWIGAGVRAMLRWIFERYTITEKTNHHSAQPI